MATALITTPRLCLRPMTQADVGDIHALVTRPEVARMLFMFSPDWTHDEAKAFVGEWAWQGKLRFRLSVEAKGEWLGWIGVSDDPTPEIFYAMTAAASGNGYAQEAVRGFCGFLFARFGLSALSAGVFADNPASVRVLEKCGFRRVSEALHASCGRAEPALCWMYEMTRPQAVELPGETKGRKGVKSELSPWG